jgi:hypothetical protein
MDKEKLQQAVNTVGRFIDAIAQAADAIRNLADFKPISDRALRRFHGMLDYEGAGCPYGKSIRGFKKWMKYQSTSQA